MLKSRKILTVALVAAALNCQAQIRLQVLSATRRETDTLYYGLENSISLKGLGKGDSVRVGETMFQANADTVLTWMLKENAERGHRFDSLLVYRKRKPVLSKRFIFRDPGKMTAVLPGVFGMDATQEQVRQAGRLIVRYPDADFTGQHYMVQSFQMATFAKGYLTSQTNSAGAKLVPEQLSILKQLASGERIKFRKIVAGCEGCTPVNLPDVTIDLE